MKVRLCNVVKCIPKVSFAIDDKFQTRCHIKLSCSVINCILFKSWKIVLCVNLKNILIMHILYIVAAYLLNMFTNRTTIIFTHFIYGYVIE